MSKLITTCQGDLLKRFFFEKILFLLIIETWANFFLAFRQKLLCGVVKTAVCLCVATICGKTFFCQKCFSLIILGHSAKTGPFFETLSIKLTKLHCTRPHDQFEDIYLFWQSFCVFFQCFMEIKQRNNGFFRRKTIGSFVNPAYHVSKGILCREFFCEKVLFFSSLGIERLFPVISTEICRSRFQYCFLLVKWTSVWWKNFCPKFFFPSFLDIDRKIISLCSNFFRPSWRHCNLRVQGINLRT